MRRVNPLPAWTELDALPSLTDTEAMIAVAILLGAAFFVSLVSYMLVWYQACSDGHARLLERESGGRPRRALALLVLQSMASQILAFLGLVFLLAPRFCLRGTPRNGAPDGPPTLLVHGLYHSAGAWVLFRRRLVRLGVTDTTACTFNTYAKTVDTLTEEVARRIRELADARPGRRIAVVGHSLGCMLVRAALLRHPELEDRLCAAVFLGAPHHGSRLSVFGVGRSIPFLEYDGQWTRELNADPTPRRVKILSLYTIWNNMVLPASSLLPPAGARWEREAVGRVNHVGLLYHRPTTRRVASFLLGSGESAENQA